jgi:hypothetical protein
MAAYVRGVGRRGKTDPLDAQVIARYADHERDQLRAIVRSHAFAKLAWSPHADQMRRRNVLRMRNTTRNIYDTPLRLLIYFNEFADTQRPEGGPMYQSYRTTPDYRSPDCARAPTLGPPSFASFPCVQPFGSAGGGVCAGVPAFGHHYPPASCARRDAP